MTARPVITTDAPNGYDFEHCYRAVRARDRRFDGWFFTAVTSTGIYCRPSCPALAPRRENVRFFPTAAAAQGAGFRACLRCRPDAAPGSPLWDARGDTVARAMRLILDGTVDRTGVSGLARSLGYSTRQLHRLLVNEVGAGPVALAVAQRAQTARTVLESTDLSMAQVAFAAGFSSVRQFNDTVRQVFAMTPTQLRQRALRSDGHRHAGGSRDKPTTSAPGLIAVPLRLPVREPFDWQAALAFLAARCTPGVEAVANGRYRRSVTLEHGNGFIEIQLRNGMVHAVFRLADLRDLTTAVNRTRRLLDLDADPVAVDAELRNDPVLGDLVRRAPGRRVPGTVACNELVVRAIVGQQVSVRSARATCGRLAATHGKRLKGDPAGSGSRCGPITHLFPSVEELADIDPSRLPMPRTRARAVVQFASMAASGCIEVGPGSDPQQLARQMARIPGVGGWTTAYVTMRALGDPDVFLPTDAAVLRSLRRLGGIGDAAGAQTLARRWRPWRSYATTHLWALDERKDGSA